MFPRTSKLRCLLRLYFHPTSGFTLTELLISIGIIAILFAVLLPSVNSSLQKAKFVRCVNNIRQSGSMILSRAAENNNQIKLGSSSMWWTALRESGNVHYATDADDATTSLRCPLMDRETYPYPCVSYALVQNAGALIVRDAGPPVVQTVTPKSLLSLGDDNYVKRGSAQCPLLVHAFTDGSGIVAPWHWGKDDATNKASAASGTKWTKDIWVHGRYGPVFFADGHVETPKGIYFDDGRWGGSYPVRFKVE